MNDLRKHRLYQLLYLAIDTLSAGLVCALMGHTHWTEMVPYVLGSLVVYYLSGYYMQSVHRHVVKELLTTLLSTGLMAVAAFYVFRHQARIWWEVLFVMTYVPRLIITLLTGPQPLNRLPRNEIHMTDMELACKRMFDIVVSLTVLVVLSPVYALLAIAVRATSHGPAIYRQERIGHRGKPFNILKFRTMYADSEGQTPRLSQDDDPRITPIGRWLRRYRLDELPQMWNILVGEMSFVGPRPERRYFIEQITAIDSRYPLVYRVRPGLTSWGPIRVGYTDTMDKMIERLHYDLEYMDNMSLVLDAQILFYTVAVLVDGKGK